jgi:hypothetical protein
MKNALQEIHSSGTPGSSLHDPNFRVLSGLPVFRPGGLDLKALAVGSKTGEGSR